MKREGSDGCCSARNVSLDDDLFVFLNDGGIGGSVQLVCCDYWKRKTKSKNLLFFMWRLEIFPLYFFYLVVDSTAVSALLIEEEREMS